MPQQNALPSWVALNNANNGSSTGIQDVITGQPIAAGGLNPGDYFDLTTQEAQQNQYNANGILFGGRYRWVQVDSGATAANVQTGTIGLIRNGSFLSSVAITAAGSGQTNGVYQIAANVGSGGGSGAVIQVVIAGGLITQATVVFAGFGYTSVPTFTISKGGTSGTVVGQLNTSPNKVTSFDQAGVTAPTTLVRPVVFLNSPTPGNWTFIQELGIATVLGNAAIGGGNAPGGYVNAVVGNSGTVTTTAASGSPIGSTIGVAIDTPLASNLFKIQLGYAAMILQD